MEDLRQAMEQMNSRLVQQEGQVQQLQADRSRLEQELVQARAAPASTPAATASYAVIDTRVIGKPD